MGIIKGKIKNELKLLIFFLELCYLLFCQSHLKEFFINKKPKIKYFIFITEISFY